MYGVYGHRFEDFVRLVVLKSRGEGGGEIKIEFDAVSASSLPSFFPPHVPRLIVPPLGGDQGEWDGDPMSPPVLHQRTVCGCHSRQNL